jgi:hypothetical protein
MMMFKISSLLSVNYDKLKFSYLCVKAVPLQAWSGPEGEVKIPRFLDNGTVWW